MLVQWFITARSIRDISSFLCRYQKSAPETKKEKKMMRAKWNINQEASPCYPCSLQPACLVLSHQQLICSSEMRWWAKENSFTWLPGRSERSNLLCGPVVAHDSVRRWHAAGFYYWPKKLTVMLLYSSKTRRNGSSADGDTNSVAVALSPNRTVDLVGYLRTWPLNLHAEAKARWQNGSSTWERTYANFHAEAKAR